MARVFSAEATYRDGERLAALPANLFLDSLRLRLLNVGDDYACSLFRQAEAVGAADADAAAGDDGDFIFQAHLFLLK